MTRKMLLVNFENVQSTDLEKLRNDMHVGFVLGAKQTKLPTELARQAQTLPKKRKGLEGKIKGWFQKLSEEERAAPAKRLADEGYAREEKAAIAYFLKARE